MDRHGSVYLPQSSPLRVDGKDIFPKLPVQLREYYNAFERNRRIRKAMKKTKKPQDLLKKYVASYKPVEEQAASLIARNREDNVQESTATATEAQLVARLAAASALPRPAMPAQAPPSVPVEMQRNQDLGCIAVFGEPIGALQGLGQVQLPPQGPLPTTFARSCAICRFEGKDPMEAQFCSGKTRRSLCPNKVPGKKYPKT